MESDHLQVVNFLLLLFSQGSRVQRRDIIRMYDTSSPKEKLV